MEENTDANTIGIKNTNPALCPKCNNTFQIKEKNGTIHICFDCLVNGKMDQHGDKTKMRDAKDFNIRL